MARRPGEPWGGGLAADGDGQERGTANRQGRLEGVEKERDFSGRSVRLFLAGTVQSVTTFVAALV